MENTNLSLSPIAQTNLSSARKWAALLAILGFIIIGLVLVMQIITAISFYSADSSSVSTILFAFIPTVIFMVIYFVPLYFLYRFTQGVKTAIERQSSLALDVAFLNLMLHYKYISILVIIGLLMSIGIIFSMFKYGPVLLGM